MTANVFLLNRMVADLQAKMTYQELTIRAAAVQIGTKPTRLHRLIRRQRQPQLAELLDVCDWLCQPVGAYFADEDAPSPTGDPSAEKFEPASPVCCPECHQPLTVEASRLVDNGHSFYICYPCAITYNDDGQRMSIPEAVWNSYFLPNPESEPE